MPTRIVINQNQLAQFLTGPESKAVRLVQDAQRVTLNAARKRAPVDTGQLRLHHRQSNVRVDSSGRVFGSVEATQDYALAVHEGTKPHVITPRKGKALTWTMGGTQIFAKSVKHPGTKARPWLLNAAKAEAGRLGFEVNEVSD